MNTWQKIIVGLVLLGVWAGFAAAGMTAVEPLIEYLKLAAAGLGLVQIALINPSKPKE